MAIITLADGLSSLERKTRWAGMSFIAVLALTAAMLLSAVIVPKDAAGISFLVGGIAVTWMLVLLASYVLVLAWIYRAHANLRLADTEGLAFTPGWAVGWYFIPIGNLFKPYQAMRELWASSQGLSDRYGDEGPGPIKLWWGFWIAGSILTNFAGGFGLILFAPAGYFLFQIMKTIDAAQRSSLDAAHVFG